jgi:hypothetical protein
MERLVAALNASKWVGAAGGTLATIGVAAAAVPTAGLVLAAAPFLIGAGVFGLVACGGYSVYRGVFAKQREKHHNNVISLNDLDYKYWSCHLYRVGVVGINGSGKTAVKSGLRGMLAFERRTKHITVHVFRLDNKKDIFAALIDGRGADKDERAQQMSITDVCEILIVIFDHNFSDKLSDVSQDRLAEHTRFTEQLRKRLAKRADNHLLKIYLLINKKDLWATSNILQQQSLKRWVDEEVEKWRAAQVCASQEDIQFNALDEADINRLKRNIIETAENAQDLLRHRGGP